VKQRRLCNCFVEERVGFFVYVWENENVGVDFSGLSGQIMLLVMMIYEYDIWLMHWWGFD